MLHRQAYCCIVVDDPRRFSDINIGTDYSDRTTLKKISFFRELSYMVNLAFLILRQSFESIHCAPFGDFNYVRGYCCLGGTRGLTVGLTYGLLVMRLGGVTGRRVGLAGIGRRPGVGGCVTATTFCMLEVTLLLFSGVAAGADGVVSVSASSSSKFGGSQ